MAISRRMAASSALMCSSFKIISDVSGIPFPDLVAMGWEGDIKSNSNLTAGLDGDEDLEDDRVFFICRAVRFEGELEGEGPEHSEHSEHSECSECSEHSEHGKCPEDRECDVSCSKSDPLPSTPSSFGSASSSSASGGCSAQKRKPHLSHYRMR
ncbi:hypothetical protein BS47DRAFT_1353087, partial [Hydnum rufescens UP504]